MPLRKGALFPALLRGSLFLLLWFGASPAGRQRRRPRLARELDSVRMPEQESVKPGLVEKGKGDGGKGTGVMGL